MYCMHIILIIVREEQLAFEGLQSFPNDYGSGGTLEISAFFESKLPCNCYMFLPRLNVVTSWSLHGNTACVINVVNYHTNFVYICWENVVFFQLWKELFFKWNFWMPKITKNSPEDPDPPSFPTEGTEWWWVFNLGGVFWMTIYIYRPSFTYGKMIIQLY